MISKAYLDPDKFPATYGECYDIMEADANHSGIIALHRLMDWTAETTGDLPGWDDPMPADIIELLHKSGPWDELSYYPYPDT